MPGSRRGTRGVSFHASAADTAMGSSSLVASLAIQAEADKAAGKPRRSSRLSFVDLGKGITQSVPTRARSPPPPKPSDTDDVDSGEADGGKSKPLVAVTATSYFARASLDSFISHANVVTGIDSKTPEFVVPILISSPLPASLHPILKTPSFVASALSDRLQVRDAASLF